MPVNIKPTGSYPDRLQLHVPESVEALCSQCIDGCGLLV